MVCNPTRGTPSWLDQCNRSWHIPGNPMMAWHPARIIKAWGCVDLSMGTMHLKDPLVRFGVEGSALSLLLFLLFLLCHCSSIMAKNHSTKITLWH